MLNWLYVYSCVLAIKCLEVGRTVFLYNFILCIQNVCMHGLADDLKADRRLPTNFNI